LGIIVMRVTSTRRNGCPSVAVHHDAGAGSIHSMEHTEPDGQRKRFWKDGGGGNAEF
jgi:hypothetical protein